MITICAGSHPRRCHAGDRRELGYQAEANDVQHPSLYHSRLLNSIRKIVSHVRSISYRYDVALEAASAVAGSRHNLRPRSSLIA